MSLSFSSRSSQVDRRCSGSAMVITLALLVLLTVTMVAFFSRTAANRQVENTTTSGVRTEILARGALEAVIGDLQSEIRAGSTADTTGDFTIYNPVNNQRMVPQIVVNPTVPSYTTELPDFANLIKQSVPDRGTFTAGDGLDLSKAAPVITGSSTVRTDTPSRNGRFVSPERWNAPQLLGGTGFSADQLPYWIYLDATGVAANQAATTGVVGRFAYNIYDVGGLLDVNVAGFAPTAGGGIPNDMRFKGGATWADLRSLPGVNAGAFANTPSWLPQWRNVGDWATFSMSEPTGSYGFYNRSGWLKPFILGSSAINDRMFSGRQDLINYARMNNAMFSSPDAARTRIPALQYLTTFSRDLDAPSFVPDPGRPKIESIANGGNDAVGLDDEINPPLSEVRVAGSFTRLNGSTATPGEPLLKSRFPLMRLEKLTRTAVAAKSDDNDIYRFFGLSRSSASDPWTYDHGEDGQILRLDEVAARNREPDMVELLKAAITAGSLGKQSGIDISLGTNAAGIDDSYRNQKDLSLNYQIVQIAANIIDQFDADGFPTEIRFDGRSFYGVENLPYLSSIRTAMAILPNPPGPFNRTVSVFYQFELWNPHALDNPPSDQPASFRVVAEGQGRVTYIHNAVPYGTQPGNFVLNEGNSALEFDAGFAELRQPEYLRSGFGVPVGAQARLITDDKSRTYLGMFLGNVTNAHPDLTQYQANSGMRVLGIMPGVDIRLQYKSGNKWVTYNAVENYVCDTGQLSWAGYTSNSRRPIDSRTQRFGLFGAINDGPADMNVTNSETDGIVWPHDVPPEQGNTIWPSVTPGSSGGGAGWAYLSNTPNYGLGRYSLIGPDETLGWKRGKNTGGFDLGWWMGTISRNIEDNDYVRYTDPDGMMRGGDGEFADMASGDGIPTITDNLSSRPIILNRPFHSVAELGYAFRGTPWKSIDFASPQSGDSALLDAFTIFESPSDAVTAGRVNLNTRQWPVLKALIEGGSILQDGTAALTSEQAEDVAKALVAYTTTKNGPLLNRADLVGRYSGSEYKGFASEMSMLVSGLDNAIKGRREAAVRALSSAGTTRVWNVMIDVIAQTGRFAPGASGADFVVEGESRFWLHLAIDRHTGKILARNYEPIFE